MNKFEQKYYRSSAKVGNDEIEVSKNTQSDWTHISMRINAKETSALCVRSKEHLEHLHFMIGQLLDKTNQEKT